MDFHKLFRLFFFLTFSISIMLLWDSWQRIQQPIVRAAPAAVPQIAVPSDTAPNIATTVNPEAIAVAIQRKTQAGQKITVTTDYLTAEINTLGGDLRRLEFLQQRDSKNKNKPFVLLREQGAHTYIAQTGLLGTGLPTHNTVFTAEASEYLLTEGKNTIEVRLLATNVVGAKVTKFYVFHRGGYLVDVGYEI
ncbi:MAG: membrane protein insertase YidC, partial [Candidatus Nitrotoga sp.]